MKLLTLALFTLPPMVLAIQPNPISQSSFRARSTTDSVPTRICGGVQYPGDDTNEDPYSFDHLFLSDNDCILKIDQNNHTVPIKAHWVIRGCECGFYRSNTPDPNNAGACNDDVKVKTVVGPAAGDECTLNATEAVYQYMCREASSV